MNDLYGHQTRIIDDNPLWKGLFLGTGSAKTRTALELATGSILIICPKQQKLDRTWERENIKWGLHKNITIYSKEEFKRDCKSLPWFETIIVDECHTMLGVLPDTRQRNGVTIPKTSQLFESLVWFSKSHTPHRFYLLSATPVSKPMNLWAIGILLGKDWDFFRFREKYYIQRKMGYRSIWIPKGTKELKERLAQVTKTLGYTGQLSDYFNVPEQIYETVYVSLGRSQVKELAILKTTEADPMARRAKERTIENGIAYEHMLYEDRMMPITRYFQNEKIDYIVQKAKEIPKLLIFANYIGQIDMIADSLIHKGYTVLTLTGNTKNRGSVIQQAESLEQCIVISQCSISSGYELKTFSHVIFASLSYRVLDRIQAEGRVLRADALKINHYTTLVVRGGIDEECYKSIAAGKDFQELVMQ